MAKVKGNSFEAREMKSKKRSSIVKMSELRVDNLVDEEINKKEVTQEKPKVEAKVEVIEVTKPIEKVEPKVEEVVEEIKKPEIKVEIPEVVKQEPEKIVYSPIEKEVENAIEINRNEFFNLNIKNDVFEGKMTTVRVYDDILDTLKKYASMKNYPIIEFTNKVITLGLEDIENFGMIQISEIKLKNNSSRSIMYNLTDVMEEKLNKYIKEMNKKGYKISRNVILNVILNETLKKFYQ